MLTVMLIGFIQILDVHFFICMILTCGYIYLDFIPISILRCKQVNIEMWKDVRVTVSTTTLFFTVNLTLPEIDRSFVPQRPLVTVAIRLCDFLQTINENRTSLHDP